MSKSLLEEGMLAYHITAAITACIIIIDMAIPLTRATLQKVDCCFNKVQLPQLHDAHAFLSAYSASLSTTGFPTYQTVNSLMSGTLDKKVRNYEWSHATEVTKLC